MTASNAVFLLVVFGMLLHTATAIGSLRQFGAVTRAGVLAVIVIGWLVVPGTLAYRGVLDRYTPMPAPALMLIAIVSVATVALMLSPIGTALSEISLVWLVGFQSFRIPVEWWLHRLYVEGVAPIQMTYAGRNFDMVTGVTALLLGIWLAIGQPPRAVVRLWNIVGLALLGNIVVIAVLSTPTPLRVFHNQPANLLPSMFPHVWLPTFLVQAALAGHILVIRAINRRPRR